VGNVSCANRGAGATVQTSVGFESCAERNVHFVKKNVRLLNLFAYRPSLRGAKRRARGADRLRRRGAVSPHAGPPWSFTRRLASLRPPIGCARRLASLRLAGPCWSAPLRRRPPAPPPHLLPSASASFSYPARDQHMK
jgi:hypothetical protein